MDSNVRFEIQARAFSIMTGMLAPGKDQAAASCGGYTDDQRRQTWEGFRHLHGKAIDAVLTAVAEREEMFSE